MKNYFLGACTIILLFIIIAASTPNTLFTIKPALPLSTKIITYPRLFEDVREQSKDLNNKITAFTSKGFIVKSITEHTNIIIVVLEKY